MANPILKLGLPKGSLEDPTIDLFDRAGWKVRKHPRNYFPDINDPEITARLCRVQEIPLYIQDGVLDLGLTGKDWVKETKADVVVVSDLIYSKVSNKPARWVLAVADDSPYQKPEDLAGRRIATELMGVCTEYFKEHPGQHQLFVGRDRSQGCGRPRRRHRGSDGDGNHHPRP